MQLRPILLVHGNTAAKLPTSPQLTQLICSNVTDDIAITDDLAVGGDLTVTGTIEGIG